VKEHKLHTLQFTLKRNNLFAHSSIAFGDALVELNGFLHEERISEIKLDLLVKMLEIGTLKNENVYRFT
jgi:hypothetical protein